MTTTTQTRPQPGVSPFDVIVIGAGQSGLAIGRQLQQRGRTFLIVDAGGEVGHVWRSRWDSLTLFTAARYSGLPGLPFPGDPDSYPTKDAAAQYLRDYATTFGLPIRHNTRVTRVTRVTRDGADSRSTPTARPSAPPGWLWPPGRSRTRSSPRSRRESGRTFRNCTAPTTATPGSCPMGRSWSSAPPTPARRSQQNSTRADPWRWPADPPPAHCRNGSWAETCSGGSPRPD